jgi:hypothetical protein
MRDASRTANATASSIHLKFIAARDNRRRDKAESWLLLTRLPHPVLSTLAHGRAPGK